jgi:hypothetical protein
VLRRQKVIGHKRCAQQRREEGGAAVEHNAAQDDRGEKVQERVAAQVATPGELRPERERDQERGHRIARPDRKALRDECQPEELAH